MLQDTLGAKPPCLAARELKTSSPRTPSLCCLQSSDGTLGRCVSREGSQEEGLKRGRERRETEKKSRHETRQKKAGRPLDLTGQKALAESPGPAEVRHLFGELPQNSCAQLDF